MRETENVEAVETSLRIKRRGHPMKRGRDNENNECVEIPSPIKRRGRPKKSGRDNENQDAEAVDLLLSIKRCGRPTKHSYHGNVKDVNEPIAEKINDEERDAEETPSAFVETKDEQTVHDSSCSKYVDEKYTAKENRNVEQAEAQVENAELIDECHNNVECSKNVKDKDTDPTVENNDADENTEHTASAFDDIQEEENADDAESVETPSPNKRRGRPMKRGRDNENDEYEKFEFVDVPSPIKRRGRPKKSGRDNEIKDAEAVELSSSVKSRGGPWKQSYHGNVKVGQLAEMKTFEQGFRGAWFRCKINDIDLKKNKIKLEYYDFEE
ncbi:ulp1 protease family, C-terminal catalytic domain-containing protein, partial [Tanacetum coccineum]